MEYVNYERLEEVKLYIKILLIFLTIPALSWWWNYIKGFFITEYYEENNCCEHCHRHLEPTPPDNLSVSDPILPYRPDSGGMAVPPMTIPEREKEYIGRR